MLLTVALSFRANQALQRSQQVCLTVRSLHLLIQNLSAWQGCTALLALIGRTADWPLHCDVRLRFSEWWLCSNFLLQADSFFFFFNPLWSSLLRPYQTSHININGRTCVLHCNVWCGFSGSLEAGVGPRALCGCLTLFLTDGFKLPVSINLYIVFYKWII